VEPQSGDLVREWRMPTVSNSLAISPDGQTIASGCDDMSIHLWGIASGKELGYVPASQIGAELLFDVISTAYERSSVIVTTNLPFEEWKEVLGSERRTGAILDRLTHRCTIVETGRDSYRLKEARKRRSGATTELPLSTIDERVAEG
jgi:hypothetical protein